MRVTPPTLTANAYNDDYVRNLFDRMGPTYDWVNRVSSFGFSELWRRQCVINAGIGPGETVCDMMAGSGECWPYVLRRGATVISIDFSRVMVERQRRRRERVAAPVDVRCENALRTSLSAGSIDAIVCAFGLKTLPEPALREFAAEIARLLKPGGRFSALEISHAEGWILGPIFRWYLRSAIPLIGKLFLGDIECYRMLGAYTGAFGDCQRALPAFQAAGLSVELRTHFFGCATSLVGMKPA